MSGERYSVVMLGEGARRPSKCGRPEGGRSYATAAVKRCASKRRPAVGAGPSAECCSAGIRKSRDGTLGLVGLLQRNEHRHLVARLGRYRLRERKRPRRGRDCSRRQAAVHAAQEAAAREPADRSRDSLRLPMQIGDCARRCASPALGDFRAWCCASARARLRARAAAPRLAVLMRVWLCHVTARNPPAFKSGAACRLVRARPRRPMIIVGTSQSDKRSVRTRVAA